jgi:hypothetical protein
MYKVLCRRRRGREEGGGQQWRWHKWHRVALDGEAAKAENVGACKSRKGSLAVTAAAAADAAAAHKILDNTLSLQLLDVQTLAEICNDCIVGDGEVGGMVPTGERGGGELDNLQTKVLGEGGRKTYRPRMNSFESFFTSSSSTISDSQSCIAPLPVESGSRSTAILSFPSTLVKTDRDEHFAMH